MRDALHVHSWDAMLFETLVAQRWLRTKGRTWQPTGDTLQLHIRQPNGRTFLP